MRKAAVSKKLSLCGNEEIRFWTKGMGLKSEELRTGYKEIVRKY